MVLEWYGAESNESKLGVSCPAVRTVASRGGFNEPRGNEEEMLLLHAWVRLFPYH